MHFDDLAIQIQHYPLLVPGKALWRLLGFETYPAFARAAKRGAIPFRLERFTGRRGFFARREDVERWLADILRRPPSTPMHIAVPTNQPT